MNHFKAAGRCSTTQHDDNVAASHTPIPDKEDQEIFEGNHIHAGAKSYRTAGEDKKVGEKNLQGTALLQDRYCWIRRIQQWTREP